jgi:BrxA
MIKMIAKSNKPYSMPFSTGGLFLHYSVLLAELYTKLGDWQCVRAKVIESNLLQSRTQNTAQRVYREIISRLKRLTPDQLLVLANGYRHPSFLVA